MKTTTIILLLDSAKNVVGSDAKTAKRLGLGREVVSNWRGGRKNPQPEDAALVAWVAGLDANAWMRRAMIEKHCDTKKGDLIASALGEKKDEQR